MADGGLTIIKRKKVVGGDGHHGGAWKVAYADFVTAMMAFFLLLWLLGSTSEDQRKGLADYFSPQLPVFSSSSGGDGPSGGESVFQDQARPETASSQAGQDDKVEEASEEKATSFTTIEQALAGMRGESSVDDVLLEHVRTRVTEDGLVIEVFDLPGDPLFTPGEATPSRTLSAVLTLVVEALILVENELTIDAHLASQPLTTSTDFGWILSAERALTVRLLLAAGGVAPGRFAAVAGEADARPAVEDVFAARNERLEITVLRSDVMPR